MTRRRIPDWVVYIGLPLLIVGLLWFVVAYGKVQSCQASNEFRRFQSSYLHDQVGQPVTAAPGFDELPDDLRATLLALGPVLDAGRAKRQAYADAYSRDFPVKSCSLFRWS